MDYAIDIKDHEAQVRMSGRLTFNDHAKLRALIKEMSTNSAKRLGLTLRMGIEHTDASLVSDLRGLPNRWTQEAKNFDPV